MVGCECIQKCAGIDRQKTNAVLLGVMSVGDSLVWFKQHRTNVFSRDRPSRRARRTAHP